MQFHVSTQSRTRTNLNIFHSANFGYIVAVVNLNTRFAKGSYL